MWGRFWLNLVHLKDLISYLKCDLIFYGWKKGYVDWFLSIILWGRFFLSLDASSEFVSGILFLSHL